MVDLIELQDILGVTFRNAGLLEKSLVHRSFLHEHPEYGGGSNERLEFLGDAVLGMLFADKLYRDFPTQAEGELTRKRSMLVRSSTLTLVATRLNLGKFLILGKGEDESGGRNKPVNLARVMEAVIGAIYVDSGIDIALNFILRTFDNEIMEYTADKTGVDFKSHLQEFVQDEYHQTPKYYIVKTSGPDHSKSFTVEVSLGDEILAVGNGKSKKKAEMEAARIALDNLKV